MKLAKLFLVLVLLVPLLPADASAQSETYFYGVPWIGTTFFSGGVGAELQNFQTNVGPLSADQAQISNAPAFGAFVGVRIAGRLGIEGLVSYMPSTILTAVEVAGVRSQFGYDLNVVTYGGNLAYAFSGSKTAIVPYLTAGVGGISFSPDSDVIDSPTAVNPESTTEFMFNFGVGIDIPISDIVLMKVDLRDYISSASDSFSLFRGELFDQETTYTVNMLVLSAGVMFRSR